MVSMIFKVHHTTLFRWVIFLVILPIFSVSLRFMVCRHLWAIFTRWLLIDGGTSHSAHTCRLDRPFAASQSVHQVAPQCQSVCSFLVGDRAVLQPVIADNAPPQPRPPGGHTAPWCAWPVPPASSRLCHAAAVGVCQLSTQRSHRLQGKVWGQSIHCCREICNMNYIVTC